MTTTARPVAGSLDVFRQVLDHAIVDADDLPCGCVDDLEIEGGPGEPLRITALLVGPGAWGPRLPALLARCVRLLGGEHVVRVPWSVVGEVGELIRLRQRASELGLGVTDRKFGLRIARLPGSEATSS
ncbi:MAG TPA: hypothetical protein VGH81_01165 [Rudaea sp.]|jgi:hypothetical protein